MCWPANVVGAFFIAVLVVDMAQKNYGDLPYHAIVGIVMTFLFWLVCSFVGASVSGGILIVPAVFLSVFLFTVWFMNESLKQRGCCMNCNGNGPCKKPKIVRRESCSTAPSGISSTASGASSTAPTDPTCKTTLTGTTVT